MYITFMALVQDNRLDSGLEGLLNKFEKEIEPYDKFSSITMLFTPLGVILSIMIPVLFSPYPAQDTPYATITAAPELYWVIGGIVATISGTKLTILCIDHKKHEISRIKYRPITGVCMCDLSLLRSQIRKMENARTIGDRMKYVKLVNYYQERLHRSQ